MNNYKPNDNGLQEIESRLSELAQGKLMVVAE